MSRRLPVSLQLALSEYAGRLRALFGERLVELRLFGSFARGEAHEDSDVDVLVLIDALADTEIAIVAGEVAPIIQKTGLALAPLPMSCQHLEARRRQGRALARSIDQEGISL